MGCVYSLANNKITITGYTESVPCNFTDLHTADKAGTLDLMPATLPALNMTLTTQIKPSDEVALKIDFILASSGAGAGDTIDITGTDKDGNAQTETLTTTADGTYTTTKWFKTITDIDCNGFNSGTLTVRQNQWGVVWKLSAINFFFDSPSIELGDAGNDAWFGDTHKVVYASRVGATYNPFFYGYGADGTKGHLQLGEVDDVAKKTGMNGCVISSYASPIKYLAEVNIYDSLFYPVSDTYLFAFKLPDCIGRIWQSKFMRFSFNDDAGNLDIYNVDFSHQGGAYPFSKFSTQGEINNIKIFNFQQIVFFYQKHGTYTYKNIYARSMGQVAYLKKCYNDFYLKFIDADIDSWGINWSTDYGATLCRQYTLNLKVIDKDGNAIVNATVILKDKDGNTADQKGFSTTTNASGVIAEQTVSYGYYSSAGGNTLQSYSPHTLEIKKSGYKTYKMKFENDQKFNEKIMLAKVLDNNFSKRINFNTQ